MESAAEILRRARGEAGLSQRDLAARAGVKQPLVSRIESGRQQPSLPSLERLLAACGYTLDARLEPKPDPHDLSLMERGLSLTPKQRIDRLVTVHRTAHKLRSAMNLARRRQV